MFCCQFIATCQACQYYYQRIQSSFDIATYIGNCCNFSKFLSCGIIMCTFCVNNTNSLSIKVNIFSEVNHKSTGRFRHSFVAFSKYLYELYLPGSLHIFVTSFFVKATKIPKIGCKIFISMCSIFACLALRK